MFGRNLSERTQRAGAGIGFRGSSPPWPYVGRGRSGLPRCQYRVVATFPHCMPTSPYATRMTREQELDLLKGQAEATRRDLDQREAKICDIEGGE